MKAMTNAKLLGTTDVDTQDAMMALAKDIYKRRVAFWPIGCRAIHR